MSKWTSRFQLGQSTSVPGVILAPGDIHHIPDESELKNYLLWDFLTWSQVSPPPCQKIMTDGCGFANLATLHAIKESLELDNIPTAVQCRIAGAKVFFTFDVTTCSYRSCMKGNVASSPR